jgi:hypothetical protein
MSQQQNAQVSNQEGRIELALSAYNNHQFRSLWRASQAFSVPYLTLTRRYNRIVENMWVQSRLVEGRLVVLAVHGCTALL